MSKFLILTAAFIATTSSAIEWRFLPTAKPGLPSFELALRDCKKELRYSPLSTLSSEHPNSSSDSPNSPDKPPLYNPRLIDEFRTKAARVKNGSVSAFELASQIVEALPLLGKYANNLDRYTGEQHSFSDDLHSLLSEHRSVREELDRLLSYEEQRWQRMLNGQTTDRWKLQNELLAVRSTHTGRKHLVVLTKLLHSSGKNKAATQIAKAVLANNHQKSSLSSSLAKLVDSESTFEPTDSGRDCIEFDLANHIRQRPEVIYDAEDQSLTVWARNVDGHIDYIRSASNTPSVETHWSMRVRLHEVQNPVTADKDAFYFMDTRGHGGMRAIRIDKEGKFVSSEPLEPGRLNGRRLRVTDAGLLLAEWDRVIQFDHNLKKLWELKVPFPANGMHVLQGNHSIVFETEHEKDYEVAGFQMILDVSTQSFLHVSEALTEEALSPTRDLAINQKQLYSHYNPDNTFTVAGPHLVRKFPLPDSVRKKLEDPNPKNHGSHKSNPWFRYIPVKERSGCYVNKFPGPFVCENLNKNETKVAEIASNFIHAGQGYKTRALYWYPGDQLIIRYPLKGKLITVDFKGDTVRSLNYPRKNTWLSFGDDVGQHFSTTPTVAGESGNMLVSLWVAGKLSFMPSH